MINDETTYIGMLLPKEKGIRYITIPENGQFEKNGKILKTFYRTEDRVIKLLAAGNRYHLENSPYPAYIKICSSSPQQENPNHKAGFVPDKESFFLLGNWTYLYENGRWLLGYGGKIYEISRPGFSVFIPDKDSTPAPLDNKLSFAVIGETGNLEFNQGLTSGWDTWKSLPKKVNEKGETIYVFRGTELIKTIKPKKLEL